MRFVELSDTISPSQVAGFHLDWAYKMSGEKLVQMWRGSEYVLLAMDEEKVIGYIAVIGDGAVFAYISSLEVLPEYRNMGIGKELLHRVKERYENRYALDLLCDKGLTSFYEPHGFQVVSGMCLRNFDAS